MRKIFIILLSLILFQSTNSQITDKRLAGLDTFINRMLKEWHVAGVSIAIVEKNKVLLAKGFGYKDYENKILVTENTLFAIGSCTKAFTSSLLSFPMKDGTLDLDKPVNNYLPELIFSKDELTRNITARDMMSHRTGLPRHDLAWYSAKTRRDSLLYIIRYFEPSAPLRQLWQYNNFMFLAQGVLAEKLSGKTWEQLIKEKIFAPLGMNASNTSMIDHQKAPDFSLGYYEKEGKILKMDFMNIDAMGPAGSINSNAKDMANWVQMWINGGKLDGKEILPAAYCNQAMSSQMVIGANLPTKENPEVFLSNYGFGWFLANYRGHYRVEHGGNIDGFSTSTSFYPTDSIGVFISVNQNGSPLPAIIRNTLVDKLLGLKFKDWHQNRKTDIEKTKLAANEKQKADSSLRKMGTKPSHAMVDYTGIYKNDGYGTITISQEKDTLKGFYNGLNFKINHYHFDWFSFIPVGEGLDEEEENGMKGLFSVNVKGDIESVKLPFEASVAPIEFKKEVTTIDVKREELEKFVGEYELPGPTVVKIYIKGEKTLVVFVPGQTDYELVPVKENVFNFKILSGFSVKFEKDEKGNVISLSFIQPNGTFQGKRKN